MKYATMKLPEKTLDQKLDLTTALAAAFIENVATYGSPDPSPTVLTGKVTAVRAKQGEVTAAHTALDNKLAELDDLEVDLDNTLITSTAYIQKTSGGDEAKIRLLPVDVRSEANQPVGPSKLQNFRLRAGDKAGQVKSAFKPDPGAKSYEYQLATDPTKEENWKYLDSSSGCRATFDGLTTGQTIWIRGRSVGKRNTGKGDWSDPATVTVP